MKTRQFVALLAVATLVTLTATIAFPDEKPAAPMSEQEMFAKMMQLAQPADMHKNVLTKFVGEWSATGKIFSSSGEMPITGKSVNKSVLGGRFVHVDYNGPFMGAQFEGAATVGFDNLSQTFQMTWIMTLSTNIDFMTGTWDAETNTLTWVGQTKAPNGVTYKKRTTVCFKDANTMHEEAFSIDPAGKEKKEMELTYTRAQAK